MSTLAGQTVGKYKLLERIGHGGMAEVYKARHPKLDRIVTIKILHGYLAEGKDFLARFEREARSVANLRHPHIVQIHDFDVDHETYYMVMEYIDGGTLQDRMADLARDGKYLPLDQVMAILDQIAEALDYAHKKDVIHRDIKPSNILLSSSGEAFLADFGIARMVSTTQFTSTGALLGTPTYMSPEQCKGQGLTSVSDIYSLGVILYELLTGQVPFSADTPLELIQKCVNEPLLPPSLLRPGLPKSIEAVVEKALAKDPAERYQSASELTQAMTQVLTKDVIAKLDSEGAKADKSFANLLTERMDDASLSNQGQVPTIAMSEETQAEISGIPLTPKESVIKPKAKTPVVEKKIPQESKIPKPKADEKPAAPSLLQQLKSRPVLLAVIGLILVAILAFALSSLSGGSFCSSVEECIARTGEMQSRGDLDGALAAMEKATSMVTRERHTDYAWIWCERAIVLEQLGRIDQSQESREICAAWERGE